MTRNARSTSVVLVASLLAAAAGCDVLLGGGYAVSSEESASPSQDGGLDGASTNAADVHSTPDVGADGSPPPDGGAGDAGADGCFADPQTKAQFESACGGDAACVPFDNAARNTRCGPSGTDCPRVDAPDSGAVGDGAGVPGDAGFVDGHPGADADSEAGPGDDAGAGNEGDGAIVEGGGDAGSPPSCFSLTRGPAGGALPAPIIYATGSTAIQPYVARVAQVLEGLSIASVVYLGAGSCFGIDAMTNPAGYPLQRIGKTATYYDSALDGSGNVQSGTCTVDDSSRLADVGISDVFPTTCDPDLASQGGLPNNLHDFFGPVQVMEFVVPSTSSQTAISAEAAYMVWGYGSASGVSPWTDETFLLQRSATSGTQNMIGAAIGLGPSLWHGIKNGTSTAISSAIENVAAMRAIDGGPSSDLEAAEKTMGILASDVADNSRQFLHPLAFQDVGQTCGWYPDSHAGAFDKSNVRDGRYPIWGPSHLVVYADANGNPTNPAAKTLIDAMSGTNSQVLATLNIVQFYAKSHVIPTCAMHVTRSSDGHDYAPYSPPISCSCYYDLQTTQQTSCATCNTDADCKNARDGATTCVNIFGLPPVGYCEPPGSPH